MTDSTTAEIERTCERCGCTEYSACPEGCAWAPEDILNEGSVDVCTECLDPAETQRLSLLLR